MGVLDISTKTSKYRFSNIQKDGQIDEEIYGQKDGYIDKYVDKCTDPNYRNLHFYIKKSKNGIKTEKNESFFVIL